MKEYQVNKGRIGRKAALALSALTVFGGVDGCAGFKTYVGGVDVSSRELSNEKRLLNYAKELKAVIRAEERGQISEDEVRKRIEQIEAEYGPWEELKQIQEARESLQKYRIEREKIESEYAGRELSEEERKERDSRLSELEKEYKVAELRQKLYGAIDTPSDAAKSAGENVPLNWYDFLDPLHDVLWVFDHTVGQLDRLRDGNRSHMSENQRSVSLWQRIFRNLIADAAVEYFGVKNNVIGEGKGVWGFRDGIYGSTPAKPTEVPFFNDPNPEDDPDNQIDIDGDGKPDGPLFGRLPGR